MTPEQFDCWHDFSIRMARTCYRRSRRPTAAWILNAVEDFFAGLDPDDVPLILDWDNMQPYPEGHRRYRKDSFSWGDRFAQPHCLCDEMSEWETEYIYYDLYNLLTATEDRRREAAQHRADYEFCDRQNDTIIERFGGPVHACVRAGLGVAIKGGSGMGVLDFTAGDIRRMYPEGVPEWIAQQWDESETITVQAVVPGVGFVPEVDGPSPRFANLPDTAELWL